MNRAEMVSELEKHFKKRVFLIVYNYSSDPPKGFIEQGDEFYFRQFRDDVLKKENISDCVFIINGPGGNVKSAIACSQILRDSLIRYDCFIPTVVGSSLCYFILQSDRLFLGEKSLITQIDPIFIYDGMELRAIEHLSDPNKEIRTMAHEIYNPTYENLKRILQSKPHIFEDEVSKESQNRLNYLSRMVELWMKKNDHDIPLTLNDLTKLKVKHKLVPEEIIDLTKNLISLCLKELREEDRRFVIQTSKIEDEKYLGGYFHT
jgi:hypothetical protein